METKTDAGPREPGMPRELGSPLTRQPSGGPSGVHRMYLEPPPVPRTSAGSPALVGRRELAPGRTPGLPEPLRFLLVGALIAPVLAMVPLLDRAGWFFGSICHEMGHAAAGWLLGMPSLPAISLSGEACTRSAAQVGLLNGLVAAALGLAAWRSPAFQRRLYLGALLAYPLVALGELRWATMFVAGHLGEWTLAVVFLARALSGRPSGSRLQRGSYATLGCFLVGNNALLTVGLLASATRRATYANPGAHGGTNDYVLLADWAGTSLETVAAVMTLPSLSIVPLAFWVSRRLEAT